MTGWVSVNEGSEGPAIWDVVIAHIEKRKVVAPSDVSRVRVIGG